MKRIAALACVVVLIGGALSGCAVKAGDGDLTDDWAMMSAPKVPEPETGSCWTTSATEVSDLTPSNVTQTTCDLTHTFETAKVGHFSGTAANSSSPPSPSQLADAWTDCDKAVADYLGAEWQAGRVYVQVTPPTSRQWTGGARFYRCDVASLRTEAGIFDPRKETMKGTLASGGELRLTCGTQVGTTNDSWDDITPAKCTDPHDVEYVGFVSSPTNDYPTGSKAVDDAFSKACEAKMLAFIGMSRSSWSSQKSLYYGYWMTADKDEWTAGNHTARCYLMIDKKKINRSLKGAGDVAV
ncbi:septum formation family protein [Dactylosporangium darangshiense]|uniref:Septum formation-related domain-containing protein n=1 Tax=Dactylosporangium darangshiense TaxID=579108 RepID=A0ABP8DNG3_9ACTN